MVYLISALGKRNKKNEIKEIMSMLDSFVLALHKPELSDRSNPQLRISLHTIYM